MVIENRFTFPWLWSILSRPSVLFLILTHIVKLLSLQLWFCAEMSHFLKNSWFLLTKWAWPTRMSTSICTYSGVQWINCYCRAVNHVHVLFELVLLGQFSRYRKYACIFWCQIEICPTFHIFPAQRYATVGTSYSPVSVSVSVFFCVSVCLSQVCVLLKGMNLGFFLHWGFLRPVLHCAWRKYRYLENQGYFPLKLFPQLRT